eukprot:2258130-Lingulodinium_polyedra.AAC.1
MTLAPSDTEALRLSNFFADQSAVLAGHARKCGVGFILENPAPVPGFASMFLMPTLVRLAQLPGVEHTDLRQC